MKEVILEKISIQNFLSIGEEPVIIEFKRGLNLITGVNLDKTDSKNGVGKSTIVDALFFGIYGSPLRDIKKEDLVNWITKKNCAVSIDFKTKDNNIVDVYNIYRSISPSKIKFTKNGEDISRNMSKTKEEVYDIIGATPDIFEQCVVMSLNDTEPFLSKTPAIKKKFIEYVYDIEIFGLMTKYIREDYNLLKKDLESENRRKNDNDSNLSIHARNESTYIDDKKNKISDFEKLINDKKSQKEKLESAIDPGYDKDEKKKINEQLDFLKEKEQAINKTKNDIRTSNADMDAGIKYHQRNITAINSIGDDHCITCKRPFSGSDKKERDDTISHLYAQIEEHKKTKIENDKRYERAAEAEKLVDDKKNSIHSRLQYIEKIERQIFENNTKIKSLGDEIIFLEKNIEKIESEKNPYSDIIIELTKKKKEIENTIKTHEEKNNMLKMMEFIMSDEGVKNIIIKKMLKVFNGRLNYYLERLDAPCSCVFDEYFEEKITNNKGRECSYFNFSGGERKRIDLAMLFTFMDIRKIQSGIYINIGLYDELLDNALDAVGIDRVLELLKERTDNNNEALYIISHKKDISKIDADEIIVLEKKNDITTRKK